MTGMRRNRKKAIRRERIVMIASSAFVLAALTMTGVYMKDRSAGSKDDGYSLDFSSMEKQVDEKYGEILDNESLTEEDIAVEEFENVQENITIPDDTQMKNLEDDLDYMPMEAGSSWVEIPGLTEGQYSWMEDDIIELEDEMLDVTQEQEVSTATVVVARELHFSQEKGLIAPNTGDVLIPYSMEGTVYFATLDQYKYNPAIIYAAQEGSAVTACAEGKVVKVYEDAEIGKAVTLDLGDGYQITYGQLQDVKVQENNYVNAGDTIGSVAAPTKYYSVEGCNLYFEMTKDGAPVNPGNFF